MSGKLAVDSIYNQFENLAQAKGIPFGTPTLRPAAAKPTSSRPAAAEVTSSRSKDNGPAQVIELEDYSRMSQETHLKTTQENQPKTPQDETLKRSLSKSDDLTPVSDPVAKKAKGTLYFGQVDTNYTWMTDNQDKLSALFWGKADIYERFVLTVSTWSGERIDNLLAKLVAIPPFSHVSAKIAILDKEIAAFKEELAKEKEAVNLTTMLKELEFEVSRKWRQEKGADPLQNFFSQSPPSPLK